MLNPDPEQRDLQQELSQIPAEYQDIFRQAVNAELEDLGPDQDDTAILHYLRQRREEMRRGGYVRPDGRPGIVAVDPETLYERGMHLARPADVSGQRRRTLLKVAGLCLLGVAALFFVFRGRASRAGSPELYITPPPEFVAATETPALPAVTGADDVLQTIGGLGGALTIGRPSALELHYAATEETIALPIDPSRTTTRGELRYDERTMLSAQPVAVWIFGTIVNYGIGVPETLVRNLQPDDRVVLNTDTGAALPFRVSEIRQAATHEATALLSQNRAGMTLFSLPAPGDDAVTVALAAYDVTAETRVQQPLYGVGDAFPLSGWGELRLDAVHYEQRANNSLRIVVQGAYTGNQPQAGALDIMLSLTGSGLQTPAQPVQLTADSAWQAVFEIPETAIGLPLFAELRLLPGGEPVIVRLGDVPDLLAQLQVLVGPAHWEIATGSVVVQLTLLNPGEGAVYLRQEDLEIQQHEGGDAYVLSRQVTPSLPLILAPGETVGLTVTFLPRSVMGSQATTVQVRIGSDLWQVSGLPAGR